MSNNNIPTSTFTKKELEQIKKITNPEYNKELVEKEMKEMFGTPDLIEKQEDKEYPINVINKPEITEFNQTVSIDPNTGLHTIISGDELNQKSGQDIPLDEIEDFDVNSIEIKDSDAESVQSLFGIGGKDALDLINLIREVKAGKDKNLFNKLPSSMKNSLVSMCGRNIPLLNKAAKDFINMSISQIGTDQAFVDLESGIQNATKEMSDGYRDLAKEAMKIEDDDYDIKLKLYTEYLRKEYDTWIDNINNLSKEDLNNAILADEKLVNKINEYNKKINNNVLQLDSDSYDILLKVYLEYSLKEADKWEKVRDRYLSAIDFSELKNAIKSNPKITKKLDKYNRMVRDFNYKYTSETKKTKFACRDINFATNVLARVLDSREYPNDLIKKFICVICNYTKNFDATEILDHTFMYFTIKTIVSIETFNYGEEKYNNIISSVKNILDLLKEV